MIISTLPKTDRKSTNEDASPINNGRFSIVMLVFRGVMVSERRWVFDGFLDGFLDDF